MRAASLLIFPKFRRKRQHSFLHVGPSEAGAATTSQEKKHKYIV